MQKKILLATAFLVLGGLAWASNEPWKSKPYQRWDKTDIAAVLYNSPWVKKVVVDVTWKHNAPAVRPMAESDQTPALREHMETQKGGMPDTSPPDASMDSIGSSGGSSASPKATFYIRWYSRVIREGLARQAVLTGRISEAEAAKLLAQQVTDYEIIVFGPDMTPFQNLTEDQLKSASYLESKQSKQKVIPTAIRFNKNQHGATDSIVFFFPKQVGSGAQVASAQEKEIEFACKIKGLDLRNSFDARKMVDENGPDL